MTPRLALALVLLSAAIGVSAWILWDSVIIAAPLPALSLRDINDTIGQVTAYVREAESGA